jgi:hypothetical protein
MPSFFWTLIMLSALTIAIRRYLRLPQKPPAEERNFTCFPKLPQELQDLIVDLSAPTRYVRITADPEGGLRSSHPMPPAFHVSFAFRQRALNHYKLCFGAESAPARVYFNFAKDVFEIDIGQVREEDAYRLGFSTTTSLPNHENDRQYIRISAREAESLSGYVKNRYILENGTTMSFPGLGLDIGQQERSSQPTLPDIKVEIDDDVEEGQIPLVYSMIGDPDSRLLQGMTCLWDGTWVERSITKLMSDS